MPVALPTSARTASREGHVDRRNAHLVASVGHDFGCGVRVRLAAVGEQDVLTDSDAARDG